MKIMLQLAIPKQKDIPTKAFIQKILAATSTHLQNHQSLHQNSEVLIRIVAPAEIQALNQQYRHKNTPTNVLAFPFAAPATIVSPLLGDIVICHEVLATEAFAQHKPLKDHYTHILIHGFLHLLGYDHIEETDATQMEQLEIIILHELNIANPYEELP